MRRAWALLCLLCLLLPGISIAQEARESFLTLTVDKSSLKGEWRVPLAELDPALQLDADRNGEVAWPEMEHRRGDIEGYVRSRLRLATDGTAADLRFNKLVYGAQNGEPYILSRFSAIARADIGTVTADCDRCEVRIVRGSGTSFGELLLSGVWHIWIGYDHVLFLLVLLIPAVFQRTATGREAVPDFTDAFTRVTVIVSAFTVAHSITLTAAAMQWIVLPGRLVESAIAASVFIAAVLNFLPSTAGFRGAWLAFGFGLLHGFGFASVLGEAHAEGVPLWRTLVGFNLGVEVGQLAIVAAFLPVAFFLRNTRFYRTGVVYGGSSVAGLCALLWFWRRAFV